MSSHTSGEHRLAALAKTLDPESLPPKKPVNSNDALHEVAAAVHDLAGEVRRQQNQVRSLLLMCVALIAGSSYFSYTQNKYEFQDKSAVILEALRTVSETQKKQTEAAARKVEADVTLEPEKEEWAAKAALEAAQTAVKGTERIEEKQRKVKAGHD